MKTWKFLTIIVLLFTATASLLWSHHASAQTVDQIQGKYFGRNLYDQYYNGAPTYVDGSTWMFEEGIPKGDWSTAPASVNKFVNTVKGYLYDDASYEYSSARASVLVNTMMGINGDDARYNGPS